MQAPVQGLQLQIVLVLLAREAAEDAAIPQACIYYRPSFRDARAGIVQGLLELRESELASDVGEIGSVRFALASHQVTGSTLAFAEEEALPPRCVSGWLGFKCRRAQRAHISSVRL